MFVDEPESLQKLFLETCRAGRGTETRPTSPSSPVLAQVLRVGILSGSLVPFNNFILNLIYKNQKTVFKLGRSLALAPAHTEDLRQMGVVDSLEERSYQHHLMHNLGETFKLKPRLKLRLLEGPVNGYFPPVYNLNFLGEYLFVSLSDVKNDHPFINNLVVDVVKNCTLA